MILQDVAPAIDRLLVVLDKFVGGSVSYDDVRNSVNSLKRCYDGRLPDGGHQLWERLNLQFEESGEIAGHEPEFSESQALTAFVDWLHTESSRREREWDAASDSQRETVEETVEVERPDPIPPQPSASVEAPIERPGDPSSQAREGAVDGEATNDDDG